MRARLSLTLRAAAVGLVLTPLSLQRAAAQQTTRPMPADSAPSAVFLKRVGSAVDGFRNGRPMWVVVSKRFPYDIYGVFFDQHLVPEAVERAGANYTSVGPYVAAPDSLMPAMTVLMTPICKNWDTSPCHKDSSFTATPVDSIASVSVTFALTDGSTRRATYRPQEAEAVFLTMSAVDKLLIPYYTMIYGVDYARAERAELLRRFVRRP